MLNLRTLLIAFILVSLGGAAFAQPQIWGAQSGTLGPGQYLVIGDIRVLSGETLNIVPGTVFLHNGNWKWEIYGLLNASGAEGDSIVFTRQNPIEDHKWGGIRFQSGASDESVIDYCVIEYCKHPSGLPVQYGGGIYINGVDLAITNSRISNCWNYWNGAGIYATNASILIENCVITDNEAAQGSNGGGIYLNSCNASQIVNNIIARNAATGT